MTFAKGARLKHPAREQHGKNYALAKPLTEVARRMSANNGMDYPVQPLGKDLVTEQNATRPQRHNCSDTEIR